MKYRFIILLIFILFACQRKADRNSSNDTNFVENGVVKKYDEQNKLSAEITYQNGVRNGAARYYYSSGALSDEIMYVDDEKNGVAKKYHKNGNIYSLTPYINDEKDGIQKKYYDNGKIWAETSYMKGQPGIGLKEYKRDGSLRKKFPKIEIEKFIKSDRIVLKLFLSNYSKNVIFYVTELMKDKYIPLMAKPLYAKGGSARYEFLLTPKSRIDTSLTIVAKYQTKDYNIFVSKREVKLKMK
ncbi:toxin-antitoxin system YwqK family antitoxin [Marinifilum sp.]|uniref:toxin-antitoxin system YwqK family antitoxin n=1 Tax=Marinifilum sp. TaxID=2033137 RepID=UPI003BA9AAB2